MHRLYQKHQCYFHCRFNPIRNPSYFFESGHLLGFKFCNFLVFRRDLCLLPLSETGYTGLPFPIKLAWRDIKHLHRFLAIKVLSAI